MARGTMLRTTAKPWVSRKIEVTRILQVIYFWNQRKILSKIAFLDSSMGWEKNARSSPAWLVERCYRLLSPCHHTLKLT